MVKLFPASLGGPAYVQALRGPFPDTPFMPTGGVSADNLAEWLQAGVIAVGAGGELCSAEDIAAGALRRHRGQGAAVRGGAPVTRRAGSRRWSSSGVTTGSSTIMDLFPRWARDLGLEGATLVGRDLPLDAPPAAYRTAVEQIRADDGRSARW